MPAILSRRPQLRGVPYREIFVLTWANEAWTGFGNPFPNPFGWYDPSMSDDKPRVVITRKDKRLGFGHWIAFALTGGASGIYSAGKAVTNAGYNARTRQLQAESDAEEAPSAPEPRPDPASWSPEVRRPPARPDAPKIRRAE